MRSNKQDSWARLVAVLASAIAILLATELLIFRGPFYRSLLEPLSYAGQVELLLVAHRQFSSPPDRSVLVLGDSRIREGLSVKIADRSGAPLAFENGAIAGSTLRSWFYILRELDPQASRYRAIVLPFDDYRDEDGTSSWADYPMDLNIAIACLRIEDSFVFAASFHQAVEKFHAFRGSLLKGFVYKDDLQDFLAAPQARLQKAALHRAHAAEWNYDYPGRDGSLAGLSVDWATRSIHFPAGLTAAQRKELSASILRLTAPQTGDTYRYRKSWLARILERYRASATRILFVRLPRSPVRRPDEGLKLPSAIRDLAAANPDCLVLDENAFATLERPDFFFDSLHMNARGRADFSQGLASLIRATLAP